MAYMEFKAATVEDAITNASMQLGVPSTDLDYEIIEEGSKGILGFGKKPAVIKAQVKIAEVKEPKKAETVKPAVKEEKKAEKPAEVKTEIKAKVTTLETKAVSEPKSNIESSVAVEKPEQAEKKERVIKNPENIDEIIEKTHKFLEDVFSAMKIEAKIEIQFDKEKNDISIELFGDEMGVLIGKRGNTLDSLQYLTSLYCNKLSDVYLRVKVDTENYRFRRRQTLEHLAKNIAFKVKKTRRPVLSTKTFSGTENIRFASSSVPSQYSR